jgi:hypothetical protein
MRLIVTAQQLEQGYILRPMPWGGIHYKLPYKVLRHLGDGNYLVTYSHEVIEDDTSISL